MYIMIDIKYIINIDFLLRSFILLRDIVVCPIDLIKKVNKGQLSYEVIFVFVLGAIMTFSKTFYMNKLNITFFEDPKTNKLLSLLSIPQVKWVFGYICFFLFVLSISGLSKLFISEAKLKMLFLSLMSISGIGVIMQVAFFALSLVFSRDMNLILSYVVFLWCVVLAILAIRHSQNLSLVKAIPLFAIPAVVFIFIGGFSAVVPYLAWLAG